MLLTAGSVLLITALSCMIFVPLNTTKGVIDTTIGQCTNLPDTSRSFHILLGQKHDFDLVSAHVTELTDSDCGQRAEFRLYL